MAEIAADRRVWMLVGLFAAAIAATLALDPIPQDPRYHLFADSRTCLGVPNLGNVLSNAGFAVVGVWGLWLVVGPARSRLFEHAEDAWPYVAFFVGVAAVSIGSAYYHAAPDSERLFWDRLPMTVAFMALFAAIVADRIDREVGLRWALPIGLALGVASLLYWVWTEAQGRGDLRFYGVVQFLPIAALPLIAWAFPTARYTPTRYLVALVAWYAAAKVLEHFDAGIFALTGSVISGHSVKHLAAGVATFVVVRMLTTRPAVPATR